MGRKRDVCLKIGREPTTRLLPFLQESGVAISAGYFEVEAFGRRLTL